MRIEVLDFLLDNNFITMAEYDNWQELDDTHKLNLLSFSLEKIILSEFQEEINLDKEKLFDKIFVNAPLDFKYFGGSTFIYKGLFVELREETIKSYEDNILQMDFVIFETEEDLNTDYEMNIGVGYYEIENAEKYWDYVRNYCNSILLNKINSADSFEDLLDILDNMEQDEKVIRARNLVSHTFTHISEEEENEELSNIKEQVIEILEKESDL